MSKRKPVPVTGSTSGAPVGKPADKAPQDSQATTGETSGETPASGNPEDQNAGQTPPDTQPAGSEPEQGDMADVNASGAAKANEELIEARVLVEFDGHAVNSVISVTEDMLDHLVRDDRVDPSEAAVEYAKSL